VSIAAATPHLPGILHSLEPTLNNYGYLAVAGFVFLEDFGVPVPGETVLVLGAVYAGAGRLNVALVGLLGFCAAVVGDNVGFAIGHFGGRRLVERFGRYIFLTPERFDKAQGFFERHGGKIIVVARFIEGLRQANGIIAGTTGLHWAKFLFFNAIGAALWVAVWTSIGYFSGNHITSIYDTATRYSTYLAIAVGVILVALIARFFWRRQRRKREEATKAQDVEAEAQVDAGARPQAVAGAEAGPGAEAQAGAEDQARTEAQGGTEAQAQAEAEAETSVGANEGSEAGDAQAESAQPEHKPNGAPAPSGRPPPDA
jgi:membrane protein DedA with SNARE-associated domain